MKPFVYILLALALFSCSNEPDIEVESISYMFLPRKCTFVKTKHMKIVPDVPDPYGNPIYSLDVLPNSESVEIQNYVLYTVNFNQDIPGIPDNYDFANMPLHHLLPSDASTDAADHEMEHQIENFLRRDKDTKSGSMSSSSDRTLLLEVEYRTNRIKKIDVRSTTSLFSLPAASSLNDFLKIRSVCNGCIFDSEKQLINMVNKNWGLDKYNSYQPYASAFMQLQFNATPPEAPLETRFIVEMEMEDGAIIRDTTETVNLLP